MPPITHRPTRTEVNKLGCELADALNGDDPCAGELAGELLKLGAQSLDPLGPRGTLRFPATDRWDSRLTDEILGLLATIPSSKPIAGATLKVLGYFAGERAVREIKSAMVRCAHVDQPSAAFDTIVSGLFALHMIGGPHAATALREFQGKDKPPQISERAHWYLNELGSPTVDLQFGSDEPAEELSAVDVLRRDKLPD